MRLNLNTFQTKAIKITYRYYFFVLYKKFLKRDILVAIKIVEFFLLVV
jgi:hypothetical protein